ncbi:dnaJ homolog subfamily C member 30, mitochondrial-like [Amphiura filiformis]|uniref:dnaJ homolog subfamily C member 30, mitochondrial-like n=1 Tax=Amphiura filiformis TaxID=82378 RepID=UPI003B21B3B8
MSSHANRYVNCSRTWWEYRALKGNSFVIRNSLTNSNHVGKLTKVRCNLIPDINSHDSVSSLKLSSNRPRLLCRFKSTVSMSCLSYRGYAVNFNSSDNQHLHLEGSRLHVASQSLKNYSTNRRPYFKKKRHNFYDVLGITPKATQAQVKAAYYKLSKIYHPDKHQNPDNPDKANLAENQAKFNEISEAYNVLGDTNMRRRYDRGILSPHDTRESVKKQEVSVRQDSNVYRPVTDRRIYDFDAFYERHYGDSIAKERKARAEQMEREAEYARKMAQEEQSTWLTKTVFIVGTLILTIILYEHKYEEKWKKVVSKKKY